MSKIFHNPSEERLLNAVESNFAEEMAGFGRALPGAELHVDPELTWFITCPTGPNGVLLTSFDNDEPEYIENRIEETIQHFQRHHVQRFGWTVGPTSYPPDLPNLLEEHDFQHRDTTICMLTEIASPRPPLEMPPGLQITEVSSLAELEQKCKVEMACFAITEENAKNYQRTYAYNGFGGDKPWHHYIGYLHGTPVAVAAILLHTGVAGIYGVGTLPQARQQGIGTAMTQHVIKEIGRLGYALAVLSPSTQSQRIYQRLGFHECCQLYHYTYYFQASTELSSNGH